MHRNTLDPELLSALASQTKRELAKRSISGSLVYFVVCIVLALSTPFPHEHPIILASASGLTLAAGLSRTLSARRLLAASPHVPHLAALIFTWSSYATFAIWGLFCAVTVQLYPGQWTSMFLLLCTAALAGGVCLTLAPAIDIASRSLILLVAPTMFCAVAVGDARHISLAVLSGVYLAFLVLQARDNCRWFWDATVAAEAERIRGSAEKRHMEEQLRHAQKMESIGRLAGGVAHDFNNILTVIVGYSGMLVEKLSPEDPLHDCARQITKAADHATSLTKQLLAFSRKQIIQPRPLNLNHLIAGMARLLQGMVGENIEVVSPLAPSLGLVCVDFDQMNQILINLAANARDAMPSGGRLVVRTANVEAEDFPAGVKSEFFPGPAVLLAISDNGAGISEETRQSIFEPFFTTKEKGKGVGLGLATVYGIVRQSNGHIEVQSEPGKGATFLIYLPRMAAGVELERVDKLVPEPVRGTETILVVEDHDELRSLIVNTLEARGFRVLQAQDGWSALSEAAQYTESIELLFTDVIMPDITGKDVADQLTALRPGLKVLFMSGYSGEIIAHHGVLEIGVDYLPKPFTPEALASKIRQLLG
jgi:signal transduction histidine kinase